MAYLCNVFQFLSYRMDFWFVEYFNGNKDLGIYSLAVNLAQMLWLLPQAISIILISYTGAESIERGIQNTNTLSRIAMALILSATIILALIIDYIIPLLYGEEFIQSSYLFKILLAGIVPFSITTILASFFAGTGKIFVNLFCSMIGFIVCLIFDLLLIPGYGNTGAAIATVIAYFTSTAFIIFMYIRSTKTRLSDLIILRKHDIEMLRIKLAGILKR
jgi:O-antigen/teichoic acid export membrane protein